jgi:hypothetical protein
MHVRFLVVRLVTTAVLLGAIDAQAQNAALKASSGLPDACKLMLQSDLEALFPGMRIKSDAPTLSTISHGPQYNETCRYNVGLPSPTSTSDTVNFAILNIIKCGACYLKDKSTAEEVLGQYRDFNESGAKANPSGMQVERLSETGDEAFQVTDAGDVNIYVRKDDLVFRVSLTKYSRQTQPNVVALARQAAKRWRGGVGMVEAATPIAANSSVDVSPDTRMSATASPDKWPDACALLTPEDVHTVFGDMTVGQPTKTMGKITFYSRVNRVEQLPNPIGCGYSARKTTMVNGERQVVDNIITVTILDVATSVDFAKKRYRTATFPTNPAVPGIGDEASIDIFNNIYMRKGVVTMAVHVSGGDRDQALHDDARRRVNELGKLVAAKLP